jgi:cytochrome b6-f complex iron-sulfur subunit
MDRKDFLKSLGLSAGTLIIGSCLGGCSKASAPTVDFTIDLTDPQYAALATPGGYVYANGVIIAKTTSGQIIAVSQSCTHEGQAVTYRAANSQFYCSRHGATFSNSGAVTRGPASTALKQYTVTINGNSVRING